MSKQPLINTPLQRGVQAAGAIRNRFNGFVNTPEPIETVPSSLTGYYNSLKRGVTERNARRARALLILAAAVLCFSQAAKAELKTKNVFLIVTDGFRWQEVFTGAEEALMDKTNGGVREVKALRAQFWRDTPEARREV